MPNEPYPNLSGRFPTGEEAEAVAEAWLAKIDPAAQVGARHHTVPRMYLRRFADNKEQLRVRARVGGAPSLRNISDLAVKDFYTTANIEGQRDSSLEQVLAVIEGSAEAVIRRLVNPVLTPAMLTGDQRAELDMFVAFQAVRGPRRRREMELMVDYHTKVTHGHLLSKSQLRDLTFVPHSNDHLRMIGGWPKVSRSHFPTAPSK